MARGDSVSQLLHMHRACDTTYSLCPPQTPVILISKKVLTLTVEEGDDDLQFKTIRVSQKGQIVIPAEIQRKMGIKKGDKLLLIRKGKKIVLEKPDAITKKLEDEFRDVQAASERSLKKLWLNKKDDVWDQYIKSA